MRFLFSIMISSIFLHAHSLKLFSSQDENFLSIKAYFSASSPCRDCSVAVITQDKKVLEYKTNQEGIVKIPLNKNPIRVTIDGSLGHQNSTNLTLSKKAKKKFTLPFWVKILLSLGFIGIFFAIIRFVKK